MRCFCAGAPLVVHASSLPGPTLFHAAAIVPAGYASLFFASLNEAAACPRSSELFSRFRGWMLGSLSLLPHSSALTPEPVRVRLGAWPGQWHCLRAVHASMAHYGCSGVPAQPLRFISQSHSSFCDVCPCAPCRIVLACRENGVHVQLQ